LSLAMRKRGQSLADPQGRQSVHAPPSVICSGQYGHIHLWSSMWAR